MSTSESPRTVEAEVAALSTRVQAVHDGLQKNNESTASLREDFARLRGQINGHLPRIERGVERIHERLDEYRVTVQSCTERTQTNEKEIGVLFKALGAKADTKANDESHSRLWLVMKVSILALTAGAVSALLSQVFGA